MAWYIEKGPQADIVLSSRIRIARNLKDFPFPGRLTKEQENAVEKIIEESFLSLELSQPASDWNIVRLEELGKMQRLALAEKHLISRRMLEPGSGKTLIISKDESLSIMILEEDHIRIQAMRAGLDLDKAYEAATALAFSLEEKISLAWSEEFGFLTACPTNTGTGLRASAMLFVPGLIRTERMSQMRDLLGKAGFTVRGSHGEGSKIEASRVQISNQLTLGQTEEEILGELRDLVIKIIDKEKQARTELIENDRLALEDRVWRALGILENARSISYEEAASLLAELRLGTGLGLLTDISLLALNRLDANIGLASLQQICGQELIACELDSMRARLIREELKGSNEFTK